MCTALYKPASGVDQNNGLIPIGQTQHAWRLLNQRWEVCRNALGNVGSDECQTDFLFSNAMPR